MLLHPKLLVQRELWFLDSARSGCVISPADPQVDDGLSEVARENEPAGPVE